MQYQRDHDGAVAVLGQLRQACAAYGDRAISDMAKAPFRGIRTTSKTISMV